jgi:hypothetical protein
VRVSFVGVIFIWLVTSGSESQCLSDGCPQPGGWGGGGYGEVVQRPLVRWLRRAHPYFLAVTGRLQNSARRLGPEESRELRIRGNICLQ